MRTHYMPIKTRYAATLVLAAAAVGAGLVHLVFAPEHLTEYLPLGVGFIAAGIVQIALGLALVVRAPRRLLLATGTFSLLFIGVYLMSRTVGLPLGPEAFHAEALGTADLLCSALEVPVLFGAFYLARRPTALRTPLTTRLTAVVAASLALVVSATTVAVASPAHHHEETAVTCPTSPVLTGVKDARGVDTGVTAYFSCKLLHEHDHGHHH